MSLLLGFGRAVRKLRALDDGQGGSSTGNWAGPLFFVIVTILIAAIASYPLWIKYFRKPKTFPDLAFNRQRYLEAHISLAGILMPCGETVFPPGFRFVNHYLQTNFSDVYHDFKADLTEEIDNPVTVKSLTHWLNQHLDEEQKQEMIRFAKDLRQSHVWILTDEDSKKNLTSFIQQLTVAS